MNKGPLLSNSDHNNIDDKKNSFIMTPHQTEPQTPQTPRGRTIYIDEHAHQFLHNNGLCMIPFDLSDNLEGAEDDYSNLDDDIDSDCIDFDQEDEEEEDAKTLQTNEAQVIRKQRPRLPYQPQQQQKEPFEKVSSESSFNSNGSNNRNNNVISKTSSHSAGTVGTSSNKSNQSGSNKSSSKSVLSRSKRSGGSSSTNMVRMVVEEIKQTLIEQGVDVGETFDDPSVWEKLLHDHQEDLSALLPSYRTPVEEVIVKRIEPGSSGYISSALSICSDITTPPFCDNEDTERVAPLGGSKKKNGGGAKRSSSSATNSSASSANTPASPIGNGSAGSISRNSSKSPRTPGKSPRSRRGTRKSLLERKASLRSIRQEEADDPTHLFPGFEEYLEDSTHLMTLGSMSLVWSDSTGGLPNIIDDSVRSTAAHFENNSESSFADCTSPTPDGVNRNDKNSSYISYKNSNTTSPMSSIASTSPSELKSILSPNGRRKRKTLLEKSVSFPPLVSANDIKNDDNIVDAPAQESPAPSGSPGTGVVVSDGCEQKSEEENANGVSSSPDSTSGGAVRFHVVEVREYERIVCDNPACIGGPPIGIGWRYETENSYDLDEWEAARAGHRRGPGAMILIREQRERMCRQWGFSSKEIIAATRKCRIAQYQRKRTVDNLDMKTQKFEEAMESAVRKAKRLFGLTSTSSSSSKVRQ